MFSVMALPNNNPTTILVSSKGQIVLPALLRRKLGMGAGATLQVIEEADGLKLRVMRSVATTDVSSLAGLIKLPSRGVSRDLGSFDPASLLTRKGKRTP
jgi:AbrB family looped-hinge helix DNA binding protein